MLITMSESTEEHMCIKLCVKMER